MRVLSLIIAISVSVSVSAQRYSGNMFSGYSGVLGIQENPASFVTKNSRWDINVIGTGLSLYSDYGYFQNESLIGLSGKRSFINGSDSIPSNFNADSSALFMADRYTSPITGFMYQQVIHLPSVSFKVSENFALGLFANFRIGADAMETPTFFEYWNLKNIIDFKPYTIGPTSVNAMAWGEIGGNIAYAHTLPNDHILSIGVNPKYLLGFEAAYVHNKSNYNFYRDRDTFIADEANLSVGFASGASKVNDKKYDFGINGTGFGLDIGAEYVIPNDNDESVSPHFMKFGLAVKDLGSITFDKNAERHDFAVRRSTFEVVKQISNNRSSNYEIIKRLSAAVLGGDSVKSLVGNEIMMSLPTTLNASFDINFHSDFYLNLYAQRRMTTLVQQLSTQNVWMASARYERRWFELGLSATLAEDKWLGMGAYVRLGTLTLGSDHFNALFFNQSELRGANFYMSLKIMPFGVLGMTKKKAVEMDEKRSRSSGNSRGDGLAAKLFSPSLSDRYSERWIERANDARYEIGTSRAGVATGGLFGCFKTRN